MTNICVCAMYTICRNWYDAKIKHNDDVDGDDNNKKLECNKTILDYFHVLFVFDVVEKKVAHNFFLCNQNRNSNGKASRM